MPETVPSSQCAWNDHGYRCQRYGVHSDSLTGEGPWYCREHDAKRKGHALASMDPYEPEDLSGCGLGQRKPAETPAAYAVRCMRYMRDGLERIGAPKLGRQRDWAARVLDRYADGDPRISSHGMRLACEALGQDPETVAASVAESRRSTSAARAFSPKEATP